MRSRRPLPTGVGSPFRSVIKFGDVRSKWHWTKNRPNIFKLRSRHRVSDDRRTRIQFDRGAPSAVNNVAMRCWSHRGAEYHRVDPAWAHRRRRASYGCAGLGNRRSPGCRAVHAAHRWYFDGSHASKGRDCARQREYADIIYSGLWFSPLRKGAQWICRIGAADLWHGAAEALPGASPSWGGAPSPPRK